MIFFLMNLVGYAGVKTGVPYPVLARASFGIWGANVPALVRASAAVIALILYPFAPWEGNAAAFAGGIGATMGPLFGIIMVDYYLLAKGDIDVNAL